MNMKYIYKLFPKLSCNLDLKAMYRYSANSLLLLRGISLHDGILPKIFFWIGSLDRVRFSMKTEIMVSSETITRNKSKCETGDSFSEYNLYFFVSLVLWQSLPQGNMFNLVFTKTFVCEYFMEIIHKLVHVCVHAY